MKKIVPVFTILIIGDATRSAYGVISADNQSGGRDNNCRIFQHQQNF